MARTIDFGKTVFELVREYPEVTDIMAGLGFSEIAKKAMLHSVGKIMTIPRGARMKGIALSEIVSAFEQAGFEVVGVGVPDKDPKPVEMPATDDLAEQVPADSSRTEKLKAYLRRLSEGEELEDVRADFAAEFGEVEASEIMQAEQELLADGTPLEEVQRLCDVHSALFHGSTAREMLARVEAAVKAAMPAGGKQEENESAVSPQAADIPSKAGDNVDLAVQLEGKPGHPLYTFTLENQAITRAIDELRTVLNESGDVSALLSRARELSIHYAKKGDLLYPLLKTRYGVTGPSEVMWTVDDEIRDEMGKLEAEAEHGEWWMTRLEAVLVRAEEMVFKEQNILFPICASNFSEEEWYGIYRDSKDYAAVLGVENAIWVEAEEWLAGLDAPVPADDEIVMPGGHLSLSQLTAMLNTIPLELTFVDAADINRFFNEGPKVFKRPGMAIDRDVFSCHPPKIEPMVRGIIDDFRAGRRDDVSVWMDKGGRCFLVRYLAVRSSNGEYLGTLEAVQDMEFAKEHFLGD